MDTAIESTPNVSHVACDTATFLNAPSKTYSQTSGFGPKGVLMGSSLPIRSSRI